MPFCQLVDQNLPRWRGAFRQAISLSLSLENWWQFLGSHRVICPVGEKGDEVVRISNKMAAKNERGRSFRTVLGGGERVCFIGESIRGVHK